MTNQSSIQLPDIYNSIVSKRAIYEQIAERAYNVDSQIAKTVFDTELEGYMSRLHKYISDPDPKKKNWEATLTDAQAQHIFLEVLSMGLSFYESSNHVYITRLKGTGMGIGHQITADGLVYLAQKAGAIDHLSQPVLVQQGEQFAIRSNPQGQQYADHIILFNGRPPFNFEAFMVGYVYLVYPNGDRELTWISQDRMRKLKEKSPKQSSYDDESFLQTKIIKHALRKVRKKDFNLEKLLRDDDQEETWTGINAAPAVSQNMAQQAPPPLQQIPEINHVTPQLQPQHNYQQPGQQSYQQPQFNTSQQFREPF